MLMYCLFLLNCVFSSCFSGKSRIYIFSNFHLRVLHEDHSLRFMAASDSVPAECLEHSGFHHCHDRVNIFCVFFSNLGQFGPFLMFFWSFCHIFWPRTKQWNLRQFRFFLRLTIAEYLFWRKITCTHYDLKNRARGHGLFWNPNSILAIFSS